MYKIYVNDTPIFLLKDDEPREFAKSFEQKLVARYPGNPKFLLNYIDMLEKTKRYDAILLFSSNAKQLFKDFKSLYRRINAAGGLVFNEKDEVLMIYRRGYWDLPKGKIDKGEKKKAAAIREVMEETGLKKVEILQKLTRTLHTYRLENGQRILKYTYWYIMKSDDNTLIPQKEEDIEEVVWRSPEEFRTGNYKTFQSIKDVFRAYF